MTPLADSTRDLRYATRSLARTPSFNVVAVAVLALEPMTFNLSGDGGEPERLAGLRSSPNLLATIGLAPIVGRTFTAEDVEGKPVVVSEGHWLRRLGGDPAAVGRTITLDGSPHLVVGVVPRDFHFPNDEVDVFAAQLEGDFPNTGRGTPASIVALACCCSSRGWRR
jgi:hypothetical protein